MIRSLWTAIRFTVLIAAVTGLAYPLAMTGIAQALFPMQANGSLIQNHSGAIIGSQLIGQNFSRPEYFHPRPAANNYDASNSGGSNYGATNHKLIDRISQDSKTYQHENNVTTSIPVDAITTSSSSLDPHISVSNALLQAARVAQYRKLTLATVTQLINQSKEQPLFAESPYVNVLMLNLSLNKLK